MLQQITVSPPNSLLFISDADGGDTPLLERGARFAASHSCVSVVCYPEQDGPTTVVLGRLDSIQEPSAPAFESVLNTPSKVLIVSTSECETLLNLPLKAGRAHVKVWTNHPIWPDQIKIAVHETA